MPTPGHTTSGESRIGHLLAAALVTSLVAVAAHHLRHDETRAQQLVATTLSHRALAFVPRAPFPRASKETRSPAQIDLQFRGPAELEARVRETLAAALHQAHHGGLIQVDGHGLRFAGHTDRLGMHLTATWQVAGKPQSWKGFQRWPTPWSIMPPFLAITWALATRRVLLSMLLGSFSGALIALAGDDRVSLVTVLPAAAWHTLSHHIAGALFSPFTFYVLGFVFALCGMMGVTARAGGNAGIAVTFTRLISSPRSARLATSLMGLAVFFDGYANAIVVGQTARPFTDSMRIAREKLAYLVDSTAAPVAALAVVSTWVGWEIGLFQSVTDELGLSLRGYGVLLQALPFRFYCLFSLILLVSSTLLRRDIGPMLQAERRARAGQGLVRPGAPTPHPDPTGALQPAPGVRPRWWMAVWPLSLVLVLMLVGTTWHGSQSTALAHQPFEWSWSYVKRCFTHGESIPVMLVAALIGSVAAALLARLTRRDVVATPSAPLLPLSAAPAPVLSWRASASAWFAGGRAAAPALAILVAARALQLSCDELSTSLWLVAWLGGTVPPWLLPLATFLVAAIMSFGTGTSWGTMGLLIPTVGPLAFHLGGTELMIIALASVLDGAVFGDHCSPISDTTIMSSLACQCDHLDHVRTQLPYALISMLVAGATGYLGVMVGLSPWQALLAGTAILVGLLLLFGKNPDG